MGEDLATSVRAKLDTWGWVILLLFLFVVVRIACIFYLVRQMAKPSSKGYSTLDRDTLDIDGEEMQLVSAGSDAHLRSGKRSKNGYGQLGRFGDVEDEQSGGQGDGDGDGDENARLMNAGRGDDVEGMSADQILASLS